jgi:hypothetical protein
MLHYTKVEWLAGDIHSNLLRPLEYYEENEVLRNANTAPRACNIKPFTAVIY